MSVTVRVIGTGPSAGIGSIAAETRQGVHFADRNLVLMGVGPEAASAATWLHLGEHGEIGGPTRQDEEAPVRLLGSTTRACSPR